MSHDESVINDEETTDEVEILDKVELEDESIESKLEKEVSDLNERLLRVQAEYENYKKRTEKEKISERKYKSLDIASDIVPVLDNFERALQVEVNDSNKGIVEGITMVYNQLVEALKSNGVEEMVVLNEPFDPNLHHAVMQTEEEDVDSNTVVEELQKGYLLKDKVIRPAMVKVNK